MVKGDADMSEEQTEQQHDAAAAQDAQRAEANGTPPTFEFDGHTYYLREGQPSAKAITYVARWTVDDENLAMVLAIVEMLGQQQWDLWCTRHRADQINGFWDALNEVAGGN